MMHSDNDPTKNLRARTAALIVVTVINSHVNPNSPGICCFALHLVRLRRKLDSLRSTTELFYRFRLWVVLPYAIDCQILAFSVGRIVYHQ